MQESLVGSLGQEDALEKEMATHSTIVAWRTPWTEEPGGLHTVHGVTNSQTQLRLTVRGENQQLSVQLTSRKQLFSERSSFFPDGLCEQHFPKKSEDPGSFCQEPFYAHE